MKSALPNTVCLMFCVAGRSFLSGSLQVFPSMLRQCSQCEVLVLARQKSGNVGEYAFKCSQLKEELEAL